MMKKWFTLLFISLIVSSCSLFDFRGAGSDGREIEIKQKSFSIGWDYDNLALTESERANVIFTIYAKKTIELDWRALGTSQGNNTFFTIDSSILSPGRYTFAVSSSLNSQESEKHSSEDNSADPIGGWHVLWIPTE